MRRRLTLFDVVCIGVNAIVGSGVFALPGEMYRVMGGWSPFAFLLCAVLLMPVALCFAELAGRYDETGGAYVYAYRAFGRQIGFIIGWFCWLNTFISWAANTTLFIELIGVTTYPTNKLVVAGAICALGAVNYFGVKPGSALVNLVVVGKLTAILCFVAVGFTALDGRALGGALPLGIFGVGQGIYLALFPLQGFEVVPVTAGETKNPRRNVPLGTLGSLLGSALLFVVVQTVLVAAYPHLGRESGTPLVDGARYLGPILGAIVLIGSIVSIGGFTAGSALGSPRYAEAIAAQGMLPARLAAVHPRWHSPHIAVIVTTLLTAILGFFFDYRRLVGMSNVTVVVQYASTCVAVLFLRNAPDLSPREPGAQKPWIIPGGPVIPVLGALSSIGLFAAADLTEFIFAGGALVVGVIVILVARPSDAPATTPPR
jgi:amino acid transporter